ncbi:DUF397 domain-containing protein [Embleya sp. NPDC050154]|uniref:DUF397 domain-containing protein n=1 Tax=Embleya sp. NPDC050154 TaxID=3363988 RepID=UPI00379AAF68
MSTDPISLAGAEWFKSSHSGSSGSCVEAAILPAIVGTRDSKLDRSPVLTFGHDQFRAFIAGVHQA